MIDIFLMKSGLIKSVVFESGTTVDANWYSDHCLTEVLIAASEQGDIRDVISHDDNAWPSQNRIMTNAVSCENHVALYSNPSYCSKLSPRDIFSLSKAEKANA
jgi:hypothetical protein